MASTAIVLGASHWWSYRRSTMKRILSKLPVVLRGALGLLFLAHGVAALLHLLPQPPLPERAAAFIGALAGSGWLMPLVMGVEAVGGALLLVGAWVPFALVLLAPVIVGIAGFHLFLAPAGLPVAVGLVAIEAYLAWGYREAWQPLFA